MSSLPLKGLARTLSVIALAGLALSISVHLLALLGFHSKAILKFQIGLFLGIFPMFILAYLAQERLLSELSLRERWGNHKLIWKILFANTPEWLRRTVTALMYYALASFALFLGRNYSTKVAGEWDELWILSVYAAAFYSSIAAILMSYARTERPLRRYEI
jgi:hypothetical protein